MMFLLNLDPIFILLMVLMAMLKVGRIIQLSSTWRLVKTSKLLAVRVLALNTWVLWQKETLRLWVQIFLLHPHAHSVAIR